jgi:hypothetical protein
MVSLDLNQSRPKTVDELLDRLVLLIDQHVCEDCYVWDKGVGHFVCGEQERELGGIVWKLGEIRDPRAVPVLCTRLENYCNCFHRLPNALVKALGAIGDNRAVPVLCKQLGGAKQRGNLEQLKDFALALERIDDPDALPALRAIDPGPTNEPSRRIDGGDDRDEDEFRRKSYIYATHQAIRRFEHRYRPGLFGGRRNPGAKPGQGADWDKTGFPYRKGDLVKYKGTYYRCRVDHEGSSFSPPDERPHLSSPRWERT